MDRFPNFSVTQGMLFDILISLVIATVYFVMMIAGKTDFKSANFEKMAFHRFCIAFVVICGVYILNSILLNILFMALKVQTILWFFFPPFYDVIFAITLMILPILWLGGAVWSAFALVSKAPDTWHFKWMGACLIAWLVAVGIGIALSYVKVA